ncbi:MAG: BsuPI-related putative proteinase inhibitor [Verrucomicrobiota bacterium]|nr:BsuPI-related putative proteinase inhibitor [Verrucomicrobiota bacterium]
MYGIKPIIYTVKHLNTFIFTLLLSIVFVQGADYMPSKEQGKPREKDTEKNSGGGFLDGILGGGGTEESRQKKLDKINKIVIDDFEIAVRLEPSTISTKAESAVTQVYLTVFNKSKYVRTFNFNNAQKYDFLILDKNGKELYRWSSEQAFSEALVSTIVNPKEKIQYTEKLPLTFGDTKLGSGEYTVVGLVKGYSDFKQSTVLKIQ